MCAPREVVARVPFHSRGESWRENKLIAWRQSQGIIFNWLTQAITMKTGKQINCVIAITFCDTLTAIINIGPVGSQSHTNTPLCHSHSATVNWLIHYVWVYMIYIILSPTQLIRVRCLFCMTETGVDDVIESRLLPEKCIYTYQLLDGVRPAVGMGWHSDRHRTPGPGESHNDGRLSAHVTR